jgi:CRISPR/Cas system-associated exonuclease Cas4 (RecB family)
MMELPLVYGDQSSYAWTPEMGEDGIVIRVSKSTLTSSKWCPKQLLLSKTHEVPQMQHDYLVIGDDVHQSLEHFYNNADADALVMLKSAATQGKDRLVMDQLRTWLPSREEVIGMRRDSSKDEPFYETQYDHNITWLLRNEILRLTHTEPEDFLPVANEVKLSPKATFHVDDKEVEVQLVGIIDRIFSEGQGGLALMELKTGKWHPRKMSAMRMEMAYYKMLIELSTEEELKAVGLNDSMVTHWGWRYSAADRLDYEPVKKVSERAMQTALTKLLRMYVEQDFPLTKDDFKCSYCDYMDLCPKYKT